jgi:hypothetical protein
VTRGKVVARWVTGVQSIDGWHVSAHVSAYRAVGSDGWCCVLRGGDGRSIVYTRTLKEAAELGAKVDATRPTYDRHGYVTAAACRRLKPLVQPLRDLVTP